MPKPDLPSESGFDLERTFTHSQRNLIEFNGGYIANCAYRKSNPNIFVVQSAEDWAAKNAPTLPADRYDQPFGKAVLPG